MDLKQLDYFVTVIEKGSFSRAAVALHLAQPSVSRQIALLEAELGQRLLERTGRGITATPAGIALLSHARAMLDSAAQAKFQIKEMSTEPSGKIVLGLPHRVATGLCVPLIAAFRKKLPQATISVVEGLSLTLREGLINGQIDLGLLFDPAPTPMLTYEQLMREKLVLVSPYTTTLKKQISLSDLAQFSMILPSPPNPIRQLVDAVLLPRKIALTVIAEVGAVSTALQLVAHGMGCSILPESAMKLANSTKQKINFSPIGPPAMWNTLMLATPTSGPLNRLQLETAKLLRALDFRQAN
jgi:LysR family transcriptional regulator, nitrogen assimilation regulatory protein